MEILKIFIQYLMAVVIFILFLVLVSLLILRKIKGKKLTSKKYITLKKAKKVIFRLNNLIEDYEEAAIKKENEIAYYRALEALKNLSKNKDIEEIVIDVDNTDISDVHISELEKIFKELRKNKKVIAVASSFNNKKYRLALLASEILMLETKQSELTLRAYSFQDFYIAKFLSKFGIKVNVLHIGDYKVAGENFHLNKMSDERYISLKNIGDKNLESFIQEVKRKRNIDLSEKILNGDLFFLNYTKAKYYGLIDGLFNYNDFEENYDLEKDTIYFTDYMQQYKPVKNKVKETIAVIYLEGIIKEDTKNSNIHISYEKVKEKLEQLKEIKNLKGLVLRINSPGGSALESEKIYQKLKNIKVPVYISMGAYCASGGYYLASTGEKIFANEQTITGSIGVVMMYPEFKESLSKNDISLETVSEDKGFDIFNFFTDLTESSKNKIISTMENTYKEFKEHVILARNIKEEDLEKLAGGRVWLGTEAKDNGLIDEIGSLNDCVENLAQKLGLSKYKLRHIYLQKSLKEIAASFTPNLNPLGMIENKDLEKLEFIYRNRNKILFYENLKEN